MAVGKLPRASMRFMFIYPILPHGSCISPSPSHPTSSSFSQIMGGQLQGSVDSLCSGTLSAAPLKGSSPEMQPPEMLLPRNAALLKSTFLFIQTLSQIWNTSFEFAQNLNHCSDVLTGIRTLKASPQIMK